LTKESQSRSRTKLFGFAAAVILIVIAALAAWLRPGRDENPTGITYVVRKMNLQISILEGDSLVSHGALEIKSQVEGQTAIISILPDGTFLTEEDVRNGKVVIELDSANLRDKFAQQEITVQNADSGYTQARESFEIQRNQNESNIKSGELKAKFARMDLERFLGDFLAEGLLAGRADLSVITDTTDWDALPTLLKKLQLGGAALKNLRKLQTDIDLAAEEVKRAEEEYTWSQTLGPKELGGAGYITGTELEADKLALKRRQVELEQAKLALQIFLKYELPKEAEKLLSDYVEAGRELGRTKAKARAELAKANADMKSKEAAYKRQKARLDKLGRQIENCTLRALRPGMVVYASTGRRWRRNPIEEGATVRERQKLITIPGPSDMAVEVKVHESVVRKVKPGLKVRIVPDAFQERVIWGRVKSISPTPDAQNWMNPDLKAYDTIITIDEVPPDLKPGMSAQVEIQITTLRNIIAVPVQAVSTVGGKRVCYVLNRGKPEARAVEIGQSDQRFIHIKNGLHEGEHVLLHPPGPVDSGETPPAVSDEGSEGEPTEEPPETTEESGTPSDTAAETGSLPDEVKAVLDSMPADRRERFLERWQGMSPEEQQKMLKRVREAGGMQRRRPREGEGRR